MHAHKKGLSRQQVAEPADGDVSTFHNTSRHPPLHTLFVHHYTSRQQQLQQLAKSSWNADTKPRDATASYVILWLQPG